MTLGPPLLDRIWPNLASLSDAMGFPSRRLSVRLKASIRTSIC